MTTSVPPGTLIRCERRWKPTACYLDDPWGCYAAFVTTLLQRGARFTTFRDVIADDVDRDRINVILDHHIDDYPLETEIMCRWEREQGARSSVYLFGRSTRTGSVEGGGTYGLSDIDLDLYRELERDGFEIGYHQNAVGRAREEIEGTAAGRTLSDAVLARARSVFEEDVTALRRHFTIETFIPHGAGQGNSLVTDVPDECRDLVWTYNNAASSPLGDRRPAFSNWTDTASRALDPQVVAGFGAYYVCRRDNLGVKALLAGPGLHHVLVHSGRFGAGMPYHLAGRDYEERPVHRQSDFEQEVELPYSAGVLAGGAWGGVEGAVASLVGDDDALVPTSTGNTYRLLTDCPRVLGAHLLARPRCLAHLARPEAFDRREAGVVRTRKLGTIREARWPSLPVAEDLPATAEAAFAPDGPDESMRPFFNEVYARRLLSHLRDAPIAFDAIALRHWAIEEARELEALAGVLRRYAPMSTSVRMRVRTSLGADAGGAWVRRAARDGLLGRFQVTLGRDVGSGGAVLDVCRGPTSLVRRVRQTLGL
jgi:hypothetical protein